MGITQSSTGNARKRMFPSLFLSNSLRSVPVAANQGKTISWYLFTTVITCDKIHTVDVLFDLPENLDPSFSELGLVTSFIPCSIIVTLFETYHTARRKPVGAVLTGRDGRKLHDLVRGVSHLGHLPKNIQSILSADQNMLFASILSLGDRSLTVELNFREEQARQQGKHWHWIHRFASFLLMRENAPQGVREEQAQQHSFARVSCRGLSYSHDWVNW